MCLKKRTRPDERAKALSGWAVRGGTFRQGVYGHCFRIHVGQFEVSILTDKH